MCRNCGIWEQEVSAVSGGQGHDQVFMVTDSGLCQNTVTPSIGTMPVPRWGHSSAFIKSKLILCGGTVGSSNNMLPSSTCHVYSMETQTWGEGASMETARHKAAGVALFGRMYMIGGYTETGATASMEVYSPSRDQWTRGPDLPIAVAAPCAIVYRDAIIVSGGTNTTGDSREVVMFNVTTGTWSQLPGLHQARAGHGCSFNTRCRGGYSGATRIPRYSDLLFIPGRLPS